MRISNRGIKIWILLFVPALAIQIVFNYFELKQKERERIINQYLGTQFNITGFLDINQNEVTLNVNESDVTIIDFWHKNCPPCITEMKEFKHLLKGQKNKVSIISISINSYKEWSKLFDEKGSSFKFLKDTISNWKHIVLRSNLSPKLNNIIPSDNLQKIRESYETNTFPTYLVLDKNKTIIALPASAVDYLKINIYGRSDFIAFISNASTWSNSYFWIIRLMIYYSGFFWIALVFISIFMKRRK